MATSYSNPIPPPIHPPAMTLASHVVSPTPSPCRPTIPSYQTLDPLLGNLSPESTLEALTSTDMVPKNEPAHDILAKSISQVSQAERALGIRAAVAAQNLSRWYKEVQTWEWPKRTDAQLGKGFAPPATTTSDTSESEHLGSLPAEVVAAHEKRIEEIRDGMESLDVDELKEHVLNAHIPSRSRPSSSNSNLSVPPTLSYVQLSDFTAVITATILRALPLLSRLNNLLSTWDARLLVLRQVPGFLWSLRLAQSELDSALGLLRSPVLPSEQDALYSRSNYHAKRAALEATVLSAGRRMDRMLDALEGREDSLPENWIDELEAIESGFGNWVMDAEKQTVENEWRRMMHANKVQAKRNAPVPNPPAPVSDEHRDPKNLVVHAPEPFSQAPRAPLMETIDEEPGSPTEAPESSETMLDQSAIVSRTTERASSYEPDQTSSVDGTEVSNDNSEASENPPEASTVIEPIVTLERSTLGTVVRDGPPLSEKSHSKAHPGHVEQPSKESACVATPKEVAFADLNREAVVLTASSEDVPSRKTESVCELWNQAEDPFIVQEELELAKQPSLPKDSSGHVSSPEAISSPTSPNSQTETQSVVIRRPKNVIDSPDLEETPEPLGSEASTVSTTPESMDEDPGQLQSTSVQDEATTSPSATIEPASTDLTASLVINRASAPSSRSSSPSPAVSSRPPPLMENLKETPAPSPRQPLDSPIKLSRTRPGRSDLEETRMPRGRRISGASADSSDYPSLVSSPDVRGLHTISSNGTPNLIETPPLFQTDYQHSGPIPTNSDHTLREDRLLRLDNEKTPPTSLQHNRALSLPLQRFINERLHLDYEVESNTDLTNPTIDKKAADMSVNPTSLHDHHPPSSQSNKQRLSAPPDEVRRTIGRRSEVPCGENIYSRSDNLSRRQPKAWGRTKSASMRNSPHDAVLPEPPLNSKHARVRKQLTAHPSLESIGAYKSAPSTGTANEKTSSRPSTPGNQIRRPKDQLDEKISSILTTIPARIHLMSAEDREPDTSATPALPLRAKERFRSISPQGSASRSGTPTPSLTLTPAVSRRRYSHAPEESSVKLYHLHQGGKSAPTKLFVRSVGEHGERVMVRVGGGWADLAEYLREYAIHHGRRHVSETPRVEVQGLSSRESTPTYTPPGSKLTRSGNGRSTPSRPQSVISNRPSSSMAVRKTRRASNVSDMTDLRAASTSETFNLSSSPMSTVSSRRRLSTSSNTSFGVASTISDARYSAIPLGLAGPKPRSRYAPMSAESEAWVEDVLGQARRSSSLRPFTYGLSPLEQDHPVGRLPTLPKSRSISDIGKVGSSKRVVLRGLGSR
ncbi:hypothetical protein BDV28DRAFT_130296 [Aspergillus coremiiformis]|uniref:GAR domain-containing protein n=1 Tax=Aspergillus coremiiformis TaxID=138285 RepID=A0A5N6ZDD6_9EURO|nr:hypothetical protein BDV28DRAFT_130296 [Aspergillus coremiiformis]